MLVRKRSSASGFVYVWTQLAPGKESDCVAVGAETRRLLIDRRKICLWKGERPVARTFGGWIRVRCVRSGCIPVRRHPSPAASRARFLPATPEIVRERFVEILARQEDSLRRRVLPNPRDRRAVCAERRRPFRASGGSPFFRFAFFLAGDKRRGLLGRVTHKQLIRRRVGRRAFRQARRHFGCAKQHVTAVRADRRVRP